MQAAPAAGVLHVKLLASRRFVSLERDELDEDAVFQSGGGQMKPDHGVLPEEW